MKAEPCWLILRKLAINPEILIASVAAKRDEVHKILYARPQKQTPQWWTKVSCAKKNV